MDSILSLLWTTAEREDSMWSDAATHDPNHFFIRCRSAKLPARDPQVGNIENGINNVAMWQGAIPISRTADNGIASSFRDFTRFIPGFDKSLLLRYKAEKYEGLRTAIGEWNKTLNILAQQRIADEDWVFSRLCVVVRILEVDEDVQLGDYMVELCSAGRRHAQGRKARTETQQRDTSQALLTSPTTGRLVPSTPGCGITPQDPHTDRTRLAEGLK